MNYKKVYRDCPQCGEEMKMSVAGNRKDAERRADWMISQGYICSDCKEKERHNENEASARNNKEAGFEKLDGSENLVAWAETIRWRIWECFQPWVSLLNHTDVPTESVWKEASRQSPGWAKCLISDLWSEFEPYHDERQKFPETKDESKEALNLIESYFQALKEVKSAAFWVDNRAASVHRLATLLKGDILRKSGPVAMSNAEDEELIPEAIIHPAEPVATAVAKLKVTEKRISVEHPEECHELIQEVKLRKYRFDGREWHLTIMPMHGSYVDRAVEICHALLDAGIIVCCHHEVVREKALSAGFEPLYPRWIYLNETGRFSGYLVVEWHDGANLIKSLGRLSEVIPDRKYPDSSRRYVHPRSWREVLDFAEIHQFRMTDEALTAMKKAEESELLRIHINSVPPAPVIRPVSTEPQFDTPSLCIDEALRDD